MFIIYSLLVTASSLHLTISRVNVTARPKHLEAQKFKLKNEFYVFTLNLTIAGLQYHPIIDTGSSDFVITGSQSHGIPDIKYQIGKNKIFTTGKLSYLDGAFEAALVQDQVHLGNNSFKLHFWVTTSRNLYNFQQLEGIIGLGFQSLATSPFPSLLSKLSPISSYILHLNKYQQNGSFIQFVDKKDKNFNYYKVIDFRQFQLQFEDVRVGEISMGSYQAVIDSGNSDVSLPRQLIETMMDDLIKKNVFCFLVSEQSPYFAFMLCNSDVGDVSQFPTLHFGAFSLQPQYYVEHCEPNGKGFLCSLSVEQFGGDFIILGDTFLTCYQVLFSVKEKEVGIRRNEYVREGWEVLL